MVISNDDFMHRVGGWHTDSWRYNLWLVFLPYSELIGFKKMKTETGARVMEKARLENKRVKELRREG